MVLDRLRTLSADRATLIELMRFAVVGGSSTLVYIGSLIWLKDQAGFNLMIAAALAYALAVVCNYVLQRAWTFKSAKRHLVALPQFLMVHVVGVAINAGTLTMLMGLGVGLWPAQFAALFPIAAWSYLAQKLWVFFHPGDTPS